MKYSKKRSLKGGVDFLEVNDPVFIEKYKQASTKEKCDIQNLMALRAGIRKYKPTNDPHDDREYKEEGGFDPNNPNPDNSFGLMYLEALNDYERECTTAENRGKRQPPAPASKKRSKSKLSSSVKDYLKNMSKPKFGGRRRKTKRHRRRKTKRRSRGLSKTRRHKRR